MCIDLTIPCLPLTCPAAAATAPGHHVLILEWCARGSLKDVLYKRQQPFPWALRLKLAYEVAEGLRCMHTNTPKIIHRDIKAENVFLTSDWVAKLGDFGAHPHSLRLPLMCLCVCIYTNWTYCMS